MKTRILLTLSAVWLLAQPAIIEAQPVLNLALTNSRTVLYWSIPGGGTNCVLEGSPSLAVSSWAPLTNVMSVAQGQETALAVSNANAVQFFRLNLVPPTADGMALIPAGSFTMGNDSDDTDEYVANAIATNIYVSAFYMDTNLVSFGQWQAVYAYADSHGYVFDNSGNGEAPDYPVHSVNWYDAVKWCNARSQQAGLNPVYFTDAGHLSVYTNDVSPQNYPAIYPNWQANGYRLPTEAEWEKAARGGLVGNRFPWGDEISHDVANYFGDTGSFAYDLGPDGMNMTYYLGGDTVTSPVGSFVPNNCGLFDMAGNVFQWCWDLYGAAYGQPTPNNPTGPATGSIDGRILRGGGWDYNASSARTACRSLNQPGNPLSDLGFRCARSAW